MSQYHHCQRCERGSSHPDSYRIDSSYIHLAAYPDPDWCAHCGPQWRDTIQCVEVLGSRQFQDDPALLDDAALLRELQAQQDEAARWQAKGVRVLFNRKQWAK